MCLGSDVCACLCTICSIAGLVQKASEDKVYSSTDGQQGGSLSEHQHAGMLLHAGVDKSKGPLA